MGRFSRALDKASSFIAFSSCIFCAATAALVDARQRELSSAYRSQLSRHELDAWADIDERCSAAQSRILQAQKTLELVREGKGDAFVV